MQVLLSIAMDSWNVALRDPLWGRKLAVMRERIAAEPGRPLVAVLGSSRTALGVKMGSSPEMELRDAQSPIVFNLGVMGAGPVSQLMYLRRLLAEGIKPDRVLLEIHPLLLHEGRGWGELDVLDVNRLAWSDLSTLERYVYDPASLRWRWFRSRLAPCISHRVLFQMELAPKWFIAMTWPRWQSLIARAGRRIFAKA